MASIGIVDDHALLAESVQAALQARGFRTTVFPPGPSSDLLADLLAAGPDLVLLDLDLGAFGDSRAMIPALVSAGIRVLIVSGLPDRLRIAAALEQGAIGFQSKVHGFDALVAAAESSLTAIGPLDPLERESMLADLSRSRSDQARKLAPFTSLTDRERAALGALCDGLTVHEVAVSWTVSESTVRSHVQRILGKLGAASQVQAVAMAMRGNWLDRRTDRPAG